MRDTYYRDGITPVTSPLIMTKCSCGHEFWRTRYRMDCTCARCGKKLHLAEEKGGANPPMNLD